MYEKSVVSAHGNELPEKKHIILKVVMALENQFCREPMYVVGAILGSEGRKGCICNIRYTPRKVSPGMLMYVLRAYVFICWAIG